MQLQSWTVTYVCHRNAWIDNGYRGDNNNSRHHNTDRGHRSSVVCPRGPSCCAAVGHDHSGNNQGRTRRVQSRDAPLRRESRRCRRNDDGQSPCRDRGPCSRRMARRCSWDERIYLCRGMGDDSGDRRSTTLWWGQEQITR